jgi:hypothetical protein
MPEPLATCAILRMIWLTILNAFQDIYFCLFAILVHFLELLNKVNVKPGNIKGGSITVVPLTSCLTGMESAV